MYLKVFAKQITAGPAISLAITLATTENISKIHQMIGLYGFTKKAAHWEMATLALVHDCLKIETTDFFGYINQTSGS